MNILFLVILIISLTLNVSYIYGQEPNQYPQFDSEQTKISVQLSKFTETSWFLSGGGGLGSRHTTAPGGA